MNSEIKTALEAQKNALMMMRDADGGWTGELSESAVSTATAAYALSLYGAEKYASEIGDAMEWLKKTQLPCGGWGDTPESRANMSATILSLCALHHAKDDARFADAYKRAKEKLGEFFDFSNPKNLSRSVLKYYGKDLTFSAPILAMCASSGLLGTDRPWRFVPRLPFEIALFPNKFFGLLRIPVVSYALPALVCVGLAKAKNGGFLLKFEKRIFEKFLLGKVRRMQPESGGFLEAVPLCAFCAICLFEGGIKESPIARDAIEFILSLKRKNGAYPIDIDLRQWLTSLASGALAEDLSRDEKEKLRALILSRQVKTAHPFTGASPGGWAWTPGDGGVPDADDTAGALCALFKLSEGNFTDEIKAGLEWLIGLQNKDGGIPTFCRGLNRLPFDKSAADISAHALKAFKLWRSSADSRFAKKLDSSAKRIEVFLQKRQNPDASWNCLWFGDQDCSDGVAPVYGTAIVLEHLGEAYSSSEFARRAAGFLVKSQNPDGGWAGEKEKPSKHIITARAAGALAHYREHEGALSKSFEALAGFDPCASEPCGLYFSKLWYSEKLYAAIFRFNALRMLSKIFNSEK